MPNTDTAISAQVGTVALAYAAAQVGKPYRWGATGPDSFDCSGLIVAAYAHAGVTLPRTTYTMLPSRSLQSLPARNLDAYQAGDLLFPEAGHVLLYAGNGKCVEAPHTGANVRVRAVTKWDAWAARRVPTANTSVTVPADWQHLLKLGGAVLQGPSGIIGGLGGALGGSGSAVNPLNDLAELVKVFAEYARIAAWLSDPANWLRIAEASAGAALIGVALYRASGQSGNIKQAATAAVSSIK